MSISKEQLLEVGKNYIIADQTLSKNIGWHDIVAIPQRPKKIHDSIYYASHSNGEGGWDHGFDRVPNIQGVLKDTTWDIITDDPDTEGSRIMKVTNIESLVSKLFCYDKNAKKASVVGVTGSVGKTTTVAFLEHISKRANINVVRFFSKRLTPMSVSTHYINRVTDDTELIVMEYSAYLPHHVQTLAEMLPPDLAFLMNIYSTHINPDSFKDKVDIFESKIKIKQRKTIAYLNKEIINNLSVQTPKEWISFSTVSIHTNNKHLPHTKRTAEMFTIGLNFCKNFNISEEKFIEACNTFKPKEKRIILCESPNGRNVFFHGETSGASRLKSWLETTDNKDPHLFIEDINFADEDPQGFKETLSEIFGYSNTFVLDTPNNRDALKDIKANFLRRSEFIQKFQNLPKDSYVIYHKALATRVDGFNPQEYIINLFS